MITRPSLNSDHNCITLNIYSFNENVYKFNRKCINLNYF